METADIEEYKTFRKLDAKMQKRCCMLKIAQYVMSFNVTSIRHYMWMYIIYLSPIVVGQSLVFLN